MSLEPDTCTARLNTDCAHRPCGAGEPQSPRVELPPTRSRQETYQRRG